MRALLLAVVVLSLAPAAGALPSPIPTECNFADPVSACASEANAGCYGETSVTVHPVAGYLTVVGSDACGFRHLRVSGSNGATGFFAFDVEGTDSSCVVKGAFVVNVFPTTDCSAVGAPPNPGWGQLLP